MARILVMDDDGLFREMVCDMLRGADYETEEASDGSEGLRKCYAGKFDIAIVDIDMPPKGGIEVIREVAENLPDIKIIAVTGWGLTGKENLLSVAEDVGAHKSLPKPFRSREFLDAVKELLDPD